MSLSETFLSADTTSEEKYLICQNLVLDKDKWQNITDKSWKKMSMSMDMLQLLQQKYFKQNLVNSFGLPDLNHKERNCQTNDAFADIAE